jgi:hypothetical protein
MRFNAVPQRVQVLAQVLVLYSVALLVQVVDAERPPELRLAALQAQ